MSASLLVITGGLPWVLVGAGFWLFVQLLRQNGRFLLRLEALEEELRSLADGLAPQSEAGASLNGHRPLAGSRLKRDGLAAGTPAPDFRLPRVDGGELALSDFRGRQVLLIFSDPHCGPCDALLPRLQALMETSGRAEEWKSRRGEMGRSSPSSTPPLLQSPTPQILVVSRGEVAENRKKARQRGLTFPIVLQKKWEIQKRYALFATPVAYLIDEEGSVARAPAVGAEAILALLSSANSESAEGHALVA
jgi:peroxiredoxin